MLTGTVTVRSFTEPYRHSALGQQRIGTLCLSPSWQLTLQHNSRASWSGMGPRRRRCDAPIRGSAECRLTIQIQIQDSSLKAKASTKDSGFDLKYNNQGPRPRTTSLTSSTPHLYIHSICCIFCSFYLCMFECILCRPLPYLLPFGVINDDDDGTQHP